MVADIGEGLLQAFRIVGIKENALCVVDEFGHASDVWQDERFAKREGEDGGARGEDIDKRQNGYVCGIEIDLEFFDFEKG